MVKRLLDLLRHDDHESVVCDGDNDSAQLQIALPGVSDDELRTSRHRPSQQQQTLSHSPANWSSSQGRTDVQVRVTSLECYESACYPVTTR